MADRSHDTMNNVYKFVSWDVPTLDSLKDSFHYSVTEKLNRGDKLTRDEKDSIYRLLSGNSYSNTGMPLQGWMFSLRDYLKPFAVEYKDGSMAKRHALDKTSIRSHEYYIQAIHAL